MIACHAGDQRPAEHVAGSAARDREINHLGGEDEGGDHAHQRGLALAQAGARLAQGKDDGDDQDSPTGGGHRQAQKAVRNM